MAILTPTQAQGKPDTTPTPAAAWVIEPRIIQFHFLYAIEDARTGSWQPFEARIESDNLFDALQGLHESHYWRRLVVWNVEFQPIVAQ